MASNSPSLLLSLLFMTLSFSMIQADDGTKFLYLRWPAGYCSGATECCFPETWKLKNIFLIDYLSEGGSATCNDKEFTKEAIKPLRKNLKKFWPSLDCPSDSGERSWKAAWEDHGVCSGLDETNYFKKSLNLLKRSNLLATLVLNGVRPSNTESYPTGKVVDLINSALGVKTAVLICNGSAVSGVRLCADGSASTFVDCPEDVKSNCPDNVYFNLLYRSTAGEETYEEQIEMAVSE